MQTILPVQHGFELVRSMDPWFIYWEFQKGSKSVQLFKEIKELISEVNRLDEAITKESAARQDIENKYKYLLDK